MKPVAERRVLVADGGGTKVRAALFVDGVVKARTEAGPVNPNRVDVTEARRALTTSLVALVREGGGAFFDAACLGIAGRSNPDVRTLVAGAFDDAGIAVTGTRALVSDAELVLWAAFGAAAPTGVVVVAGTGSIALARNADGALVRAGGHGPVLGDEGGGHWIGVAGLKTALLHLEEAAAGTRARPSLLVDELHAGLHGESIPGAALAVARGRLRPSIVAPMVVRAAERGDEEADGILRRAGAELASLATRAATAAGLRGPFQVRGAGGVFSGAARVVAALRTELRKHRPEAELGAEAVDPLAGGMAFLAHAAQHGKRVPPGW